MKQTAQLERYRLFDQSWDSYEELYESFEWTIPDSFNIARYVCDRWAEGEDKSAFYRYDPGEKEEECTYRELQTDANRLANYLTDQGVKRGDRIGVFATQKPKIVSCCIAAWKIGAVILPLSPLFGPSAIEYRMNDGEATACIIDASCADEFSNAEVDLASELTIYHEYDEDPHDGVDLQDILNECGSSFETVETKPDDTAILLYTSGTTGSPKGVVLRHQVLLGTLPYVSMAYLNLDLTEDDIFYSPASWAWVGSLPHLWATLYFGIPIVSNNGQFDPETELAIIEKYDVSLYFNAPTALRMLMQADDIDAYELGSLRVIMSGGEAVTQGIIDWVSETFDDAVLNQGYGQTEAAGLICTCEALIPTKEDKLGRPVPGQTVTLLDEDTYELIEQSGTPGEIAVQYTDSPLCYDEYWNKPEETSKARAGEWHLTGDIGLQDDEGYFEFVSRVDDVIISSGYRIGPEELEDVLGEREEIVQAGVIGVPHDERSEVPKAFVILAESAAADPPDKAQLKQYVKDELGKFKYPREIEYVDELPTTATGKIRRVDLRKREGIAANT